MQERRKERSGWVTASAVLALLATSIGTGTPAVFAQGDYGRSAAILRDVALVGAPGAAGGAGAVYVYQLDPSGSGWNADGVLSAEGTSAAGAFGSSVSVSTGLAVIGAPGADGGAGAVLTYVRDDVTGMWRQQARLSAAGGVPGDAFGRTVAVAGATIAAGAPGRDGARGAVYVFRRDEATGMWTQAARLTAAGAAEGDNLGASLDLGDGLLYAGAAAEDNRRGAVYVFARDEADVWRQQTRLTLSGGASLGSFGQALAATSVGVLAGAPNENERTGVVAHFVSAPGKWEEQSHLTAPGLSLEGRFGFAVAVDGDTAFVGAPTAGGPLYRSGATYVFNRDAGTGTWRSGGQLQPATPQVNSLFGRVISAGGGRVVVGVPNADFSEGAALIFGRHEGGWVQEARLVPPAEAVPAVTGHRVACEGAQAAGYPCQGIDLLAYLPITAIGGSRGEDLNDLWGWTDPTSGKEYALVGRESGVAFVDVTDPINPIYLGSLPLTEGARPTPWRDVKVFQHYAFVVADAAGDHGMQIFDLTRLRDVTAPPATFTPDVVYRGTGSPPLLTAHNVAVDESTGFAFVVGSNTCDGGLHMVDVNDPLHPAFAGCFADTRTGFSNTGYTHDVQCVVYHGPDVAYLRHEICLGANETAISIADVTDKQHPFAVSTGEYPGAGYVHQGWLTEDQRYFIQNDELDELQGHSDRTRTLIWDVTDLDDPQLVTQYLAATPSIDHNLYVRGALVFEANYTSGIHVLDISDVGHPVELAYFDTVPETDDPTFDGTWSVYPFFASGTVVASSIGQGLFVLAPTGAADVATEHTGLPGAFVLEPAYPNPFNPVTTIHLTLAAPARVRLAVFDGLGRRVALLNDGLLAAGTHAFAFDATDLPSGTFFVRATAARRTLVQAVTLLK